jgi:hypothetical protein
VVCVTPGRLREVFGFNHHDIAAAVGKSVARRPVMGAEKVATLLIDLLRHPQSGQTPRGDGSASGQPVAGRSSAGAGTKVNLSTRPGVVPKGEYRPEK